jgi:membrane protease YdiL (CAAX protease family)
MLATSLPLRGSALLRLVECVILFGVFPAYLAFAPALGLPRVPWAPVLLLACVGAAWWLVRGARMSRRELLFGPDRVVERDALRPLLIRFAIASVLLCVAVAVVSPERLFILVRERPQLWAAIMLFYPLLSVYPQEMLFRAFFFRRYGPLFGSERAAVVANALVFGWAHVFFPSPVIAVALTIVGGWLFAATYRRTGSLRLAWLEHALYGNLIFTVGLGEFFFSGRRT